MRRLLLIVLAVLVSGVALGCSSDKDKGVNSNQDRPRSATLPSSTGGTGK